MSNIASTLAPNARTVGFTATGAVAANNVQDAIAELDNEKSPTTHTTHSGEAVSFEANGYKRFADGTILQWGSLTMPNYLGYAFTFPLAFPNATLSMVGVLSNGSAFSLLQVSAFTATQATLYQSANQSSAFYWQAIGR